MASSDIEAHVPAEAAPVEQRDNMRGVAWMLASVVAATVMTVAVREVSGTVDSRMIVALRAAIITAALLPALLFIPGLRAMRVTRPWLHLTRGALIAGATHLAFYTIANLPLATGMVLFFTAPIFATVLAVLFQKERVGPRRILAALVGFLGAVVILRPDAGRIEPAMIAALASSAMFAVALVQSRAIAQADGAAAAFASSVVVTLALSAPVALPVLGLPVGLLAWAAMIVVVIAGAVRGVADIHAYRFADAGLLTPFTYLRLVLTAAAGYLLFAEVPDRETLLGAVIIIGSTLYIARREAQAGRAAG